MKKGLAAVGAALVLVAAAYIGSPWWVTSRMRKAAEAGDGEKLAAWVDYPALRADVAAQLTASVTAQGGVWKVLAGQLVVAAAEAMITPDNVAALVATGRGQAIAGERKAAEDQSQPVERRRHYRSYRELDVFDVEMHDPETKARIAVLIFHRHDGFGWKLAGVRFGEAPAAPAP